MLSMNLKNLKPYQLLLILAIIIITTPIIITLPAIFSSLDFSNKGQIGDALGGITAPFINSIAAILVFVAFKEQIKANDLIKDQLYFQHIQEQINRLEDNSAEIPEIILKIKDQIYLGIRDGEDLIGSKPPYIIRIDEQLLNKILYSTTVFNQTLSMIEKTKNDQDFLYNKLKILYKIMYRDNYRELKQELFKAQKHQLISELYVSEILLETNKLENNKFLQ